MHSYYEEYENVSDQHNYSWIIHFEGILSKPVRRHTNETQSDLSLATQDAISKQQTDKLCERRNTGSWTLVSSNMKLLLREAFCRVVNMQERKRVIEVSSDLTFICEFQEIGVG